MSADRDIEPKTRRERLRAIADEYTEEIHQPTTKAQLEGIEPVSRYAAVTSEGSPESSYASNGNLIVAATAGELAEQLRGECGEGWLAHGRVWDLDVPWHLWGNLGVTYSVSVGDELARPVHVVAVEFREDGIYCFDDPIDAKAFLDAVRLHGGRALLSEEPIHDHHGADRLIDTERERD
jgi:hypothetical protein